MCTCEDGYWEDLTISQCVLCHANCNTCVDGTKACKSCAAGKYRYLNMYCEDFCPYPYVANPLKMVCDYMPDNPPYNLGCSWS